MVADFAAWVATNNSTGLNLDSKSKNQLGLRLTAAFVLGSAIKNDIIDIKNSGFARTNSDVTGLHAVSWVLIGKT